MQEPVRAGRRAGRLADQTATRSSRLVSDSQHNLWEVRMGPNRTGQHGWVGMVAMLLALAIVAYLSKDALRKYGLLPSSGETVVRKAGTPGERARAPAAIDATGATVESAAPVPTNAMDRARGVESTIREQEKKRGGGY